MKNYCGSRNFWKEKIMTKRTTEHTEMPNLAKFPEHEKEKIRLFVENLMAVKPPKVISNSSDNQINPEQDGLLFAALCYEAFGVSDHDLTNLFYGQLQAACPDNPRLQTNDLNAALAFLFDVKPKNAIEGALAVKWWVPISSLWGFLPGQEKPIYQVKSSPPTSQGLANWWRRLQTKSRPCKDYGPIASKKSSLNMCTSIQAARRLSATYRRRHQTITSRLREGRMQKSEDEPHAKANDVRKPCPYLNAQHCGARTRGQKTCRGPAMKNGRCRMHGGKSTGPQTSAGLMRSKTTNLKHGFIH